MKKYLCFLLLLASCTVSRPVSGNYYSNGTTYVRSLKLNPNGSFLLSADNFERRAGFLGNWKYLSKDTILLTYNLEDFPGIVKSEHISKKQEKVVLLNNNEIKYNQVVLSKLNKVKLDGLDATASIR
ncbi:MAG: hypothetical protein V4553_21780 [Bacteroidota bacterium]